MKVTTVGLGLAKNVSHVNGSDAKGHPMFSSRLTQATLGAFFGDLATGAPDG